MPDQTLTSVAQLSLSCATDLVAFAVYRVQADKLFLGMRDKRGAAFDAYRLAVKQRLQEISSLSTPDLITIDPSAKITGSAGALWEIENATKVWFGVEVAAAIDVVSGSISTSLRLKCEWCTRETGDISRYDEVSRAHLRAYDKLGEAIKAAAPYLSTGHRGLTWHQRIMVRARHAVRTMQAIGGKRS